MNKTKVPIGTKQSISTIVDNVQTDVSSNLLNRLDALTYGYGVIADIKNADTDLLVAKLSGTTLSIQAGKCFTKTSNELITLSTATSYVISSMPADGTYYFKIKFKSIGADPIAAINGFYYSQNIIISGGNSRYTRYQDSYEFVLEAAAASSGEVELASVVIASGAVSTVTDIRPQFYIKSHVIDPENHLRTTNLQIPTTAADITSYLSVNYDNDSSQYIIKINGPGHPIQFVDENDTDILELSSGGVVVASLAGFLVGGKQVMTSSVPQAPLNFRVTDIAGINTDFRNLTTDSSVSSLGATYLNNDLAVTFKWGYDYITGSGVTSTFYINNTDVVTDMGGSLSAFIGQYIYFPGLGEAYNYLITDADLVGAEIKLTLDTTTPSLPLPATTITDPAGATAAWIHPNADQYNIITVPYNNKAVKQSNLGEATTQTAGESPTILTKSVKLKTGVKYNVYVSSQSGPNISAKTELTAGYYPKYGLSQYYTYPLVVSHAPIPSFGSSFSATASAGGYKVVINGWDEAEYYELVEAVASQGIADFNNQAHVKYTIFGKVKEVPKALSENISLTLRPIIGGQQVADSMSLTLTAVGNSATGVISSDAPLFQEYIVHHTIKATATASTPLANGKDKILISGIYTPGSTSDNLLISTFPSEIKGDILVYNSLDYRVTQADYTGSGTYTLYLEKVGHSTAFSGTNVTVKIGTGSKYSRFYSRLSNNNTEYIITRIVFDLDTMYGTTTDTAPEAVIRVYQDGDESNAVALQITNNIDSYFTADTNLSVSRSNSASLTICVDLYDSADTTFVDTNVTGLAGTLFLYGKPVFNAVGGTLTTYSVENVGV